MSEKIKIGQGALSWFRNERITNRYGAIGLYNKNSKDEAITTDAKLFSDEIKQHLGKKGELVCEITEARKSTHIGDLSLGIAPITPILGSFISLGKGFLFFSESSNTVGLNPEDQRADLWMNPQQLYNAHEQTVNLYFIPTK